jgi:hypothetical protein
MLTALTGCNDDDTVFDPRPATPQGVYSITRDDAVVVRFNGIYERDVAEYVVFRSLEPYDNYVAIGSVDAEDNPNLDLLIYTYIDDNVTNGVTYFYAVAAVDHAGQMSELSAENVFDTPRPEGTVTLWPNNLNAAQSGFNLETATVTYDTALIADVFVDIFDGVYYLNVTFANIDIQDMGFTSDFDEISFSPEEGWSVLGFVELVEGHTYVIWTAENHFAKMRVVNINPSGTVDFEWAYQVDEGNLELSRPQHDTTYPQGDAKSMLLLQ